MCQRVLRRSTTELRRNDLHQSRAGGIRNHDIRLSRHVLQLCSRSLNCEVRSSKCEFQTSPFSLQTSNSSTRNRTWNFSLEARDDIRFTIELCNLRQSVEPMERKAWELNPHNCSVALFSKQARQTVSGYLPNQASGVRLQTSGPFKHLMPDS